MQTLWWRSSGDQRARDERDSFGPTHRRRFCISLLSLMIAELWYLVLRQAEFNEE